MRSLVLLISDVGSGSNLLAIIKAIKEKKLNFQIKAVISDTKKALGLKYAKENNIPIQISPKKEDLISNLKRINPDYIALAGWKQIILDDVLEAYPNRILNLHPGLIPPSINSKVLAPDKSKALWNKGMLAQKAIQNFLDKKSTYAGSSIHFLTQEFDFGPVLARAFEKIKKGDTVESLYLRLKKKEHQIYIKSLKKLEDKKTVLVIDGGGRGSALVDKYLQSKKVSRVLAIPGNDLMCIEKDVEIYPEIKTNDKISILKIAKENNVDLIDVAQDDAVAAGVTDALQKNGFTVFGPTKAAGQIEWDKSWSKKFMQKNKIPTAKFKVFQSQSAGIKFIKSQKDSKWFIKASGLAAGKGAIFAPNKEEAAHAIKRMKNFGESGKVYIVEEFIDGEEFSAFAAANGKNFIVLGYAQDHKRVNDGDKGPNTGGMGCSSPPMVVTNLVKKQTESIFRKTLAGLDKVKRPYCGILYLGGIISNSKVYVIEFNARWGDPEAQVVLPSIKNDLYDLENSILENKFNLKIKRDHLYRIAVAAVSKGYPADFKNVIGKEINGLEKIFKIKHVKLFGAAVKRLKNKNIAAGGRLFYVLSEGADVSSARKIAYNALSKASISGKNLHYRKDIGYKDLARQKR